VGKDLGAQFLGIQMKKVEDQRPQLPGLVASPLERDGVRSWGPHDTRGHWGELPSQQEEEVISGLVNEILDQGSQPALRFLVESIDRLRNTYRWTGGIPDPVSGTIVDVSKNGEWFSFLCEPRSFHIPLERRLEMARQYIGLALRANFRNKEFWVELIDATPEGCPTCEVLRTFGTLHAASLQSA
jgi:hypothetical protein